LLTGRALFVDDVRLDGLLHVAFLRSQHAHARLNGVDVSAARRRPGVVAVYTAGDLGDYWRPGPLLVPPPPIAGLVFHACTQVPLAKDKLRHVGEPIAMVVASPPRSRTAPWRRSGTRAPKSSPFGTPRRRRFRSATASPVCSACPSRRCASSRRSWAADSDRRS